MPKQKAYCRDYDRLANSLTDIATTARTIPAPVDGADVTIDPPPSVAAGSFELEEFIPGLNVEGTLSTNGTSHVVTSAEDVPAGFAVVALVFSLLKADLVTKVQVASEYEDAVFVERWAEARAEIQRLREGVTALNAWAITVPIGEESADNSSSRAAIAELLRRLTDLESAFAEDVKKWREH